MIRSFEIESDGNLHTLATGWLTFGCLELLAPKHHNKNNNAVLMPGRRFIDVPEAQRQLLALIDLNN